MALEVWARTHVEGYEVSDLGRVRSIDRKVTYADGRVYYYTGQLRKNHLDTNGYESVGLGLHGRFRVHRLVAEAFMPIHPVDKDEVNHKDGNKLNNQLTNLEWATSSENKRHAIETGLVTHKSCLEQWQIDKARHWLREGYYNAKQVAGILGVSTATISKIKNHKGVFK